MEDAIARTDTAVPNPLRGLFAALRRQWLQRRMADELNALDDARLKDIGLYRGEIPAIVRARCAGQERM